MLYNLNLLAIVSDRPNHTVSLSKQNRKATPTITVQTREAPWLVLSSDALYNERFRHNHNHSVRFRV